MKKIFGFFKSSNSNSNSKKDDSKEEEGTKSPNEDDQAER